MDNNSKYKILIVEDESSIRSFISINLKRNNYTVLEASSGEEALDIARIEYPNVVLLDIMLPGIDGFQVCEKLRKFFPQIGIIMLTAKSQDLDKIRALEFGADDYVLKPFNPLELVLRVKALLRRIYTNCPEDSSIIHYKPFKIDTYSQKVYKNEIELEMTPKEYSLMKIFLENPGKAFRRDELLNLVWSYDFIGDAKLVDVNIRRLRTKIEDDSSNPFYIETVWGTGYRWRKKQGE